MPQHNSQRPEFARKIVDKFTSSQSNVFLVYGNTRDIYPVSADENVPPVDSQDQGNDRIADTVLVPAKKYVPLVDFLLKDLIKPNKPSAPRVVVIYDPAAGISFPNPLDRQLIVRELGEDRLGRTLAAARSDIVTACAALRELTRLNIMVPVTGEPGQTRRKDFAIIIRYAEAVAPASRGEAMLDSERLKVITLENWFSDSTFVASSDIVFMISETLTGMNERIVDLPFCAAIRIDRPNEDQRRQFIEHIIGQEKVHSSVSPEHLAYSSAGLSLLSIRQIFRQASHKGQIITPELIFDKTKEIIEKELEGHIEFPRLDYGFEKVVGASRLLKKLHELKEFLRGDEPDLMPVGILVPGANGVGKTFIYKAFAKECGWVAVVLKNIRGPYVGQTEKNWERIRSVLEAMRNVMVMYDEADTEIGGRGARTHDVDRRLFGNILRMMSDSHNRGKIVWVIITARPDRLEPDIKRSGRAGEHLPVFDHEGEEKEEFLQHVLDRAGIELELFDDALRSRFLELTQDYFPADFDHLITELRRRRHLEGALTPEMVLEEVGDFIPSDIARQREYQELLAVLECTSREILPDRYADLSREAVEARVAEIRSGMELL